MSLLTNIMHFRGETVTLFSTFKQPTGEAIDEAPNVLNPQVQIQYATSLGSIVTVLPPTDMIRISNERYFYNWTIPDTAILTVYTVMYSGMIDDLLASRTEELIIGNPNVTTTRRALRYGPSSYIMRPRVPTIRKNPALPRGEF